MDYNSIKEKYGKFTLPMAAISIAGESIEDNSKGLIVNEISVDLSVGFEASVAVFSIYNVYDCDDTETYQFDKFKKYVLLGSPVEISLGYAGAMTELFVGFIAKVEFMSDGREMHHVEVTAMDVKGLMMSNCNVRQMTAASYGEAVRALFDTARYQQMQSGGIFKQIQAADTPDQSQQSNQGTSSYSVEMVSESDYEFVVKAAKRFNFEFFVDTGVVVFRKSKETKEECLLMLGMNEGLLSYEISYDITGLVKNVEVRGMDTAKAKMVSAKSALSNKISTGNKAKALIGQTVRVIHDAGVNSKEQAQYRADSLMEDIAYRFGSLECECTGIPELKPGHFIRIRNMGGPCDNRFYVTHTMHRLTQQDGYYTKITAKAAFLN